MTSHEIRQSFLDFFRSKGHTIVPSSSLMPDAPNLLFTNAGMNQFVPIFLGQTACPYQPPRAADTQKCIRAGGKHNDLEDVGLDTYHHTFFEMLGNWSFGDYFKREAILWAWELITEVWRFPAARLYATVYRPDPSKGDPAEFDQEAWDVWAECFRGAGLDPAVHVVHGDKKDNFWMMGETGPCGPCSELHVDLTGAGDTKGALVNKGTAETIEIWNLVFIQFNANPDGTFTPLPARHVDTGMGFERVTAIIQNTERFTQFGRIVSNYDTDIFAPLFRRLEKLCGRRYTGSLPAGGGARLTETEQGDIAFRVIADHIRTLSFAIADGILPGNTDRNYVLRRILRRAIRYGRALDFHQPFFYQLAEVLAESMSDVFPEIRRRLPEVQQTIQKEEEAFNKTLDRGLEIFNGITAGQQRGLSYAERVAAGAPAGAAASGALDARPMSGADKFARFYAPAFREALTQLGPDKVPSVVSPSLEVIRRTGRTLSGEAAFALYDTYGFPLDLTELMAREAGFSVDTERFQALMEGQKKQSQDARQQTVISVSQVATTQPTRFVGYDRRSTEAKVLEVARLEGKTAVVLDESPFYAAMGGQVGDVGQLRHGDNLWHIVDTVKVGDAFVHLLSEPTGPAVGSTVQLEVDCPRRAAIQRHHSATHLLHWALHEVVSREATQKGSFVGPEKLTFDFNSAALSQAQLQDIERLVNARILDNAGVSWIDMPYAEIRQHRDVLQFFGEKYGEQVRVVQIGGQPGGLNGYSMELCGGTHTRATGEIGLFRVVGESAVAAGVRRIEAVAGFCAYERSRQETERLAALASRLNSPLPELERKLENLLTQQRELEKQLEAIQQRQAADLARGLVSRARDCGGVRLIVESVSQGDGDFLQAVADALKTDFQGVVVLGGIADNAVSLVATVSDELKTKFSAGKIIQTIAPIVGGKGGGRPENARGGGRDPSKLGEALARAEGYVREQGSMAS